eukprot:5164298-Prymnesium_polylepis.2
MHANVGGDRSEREAMPWYCRKVGGVGLGLRAGGAAGRVEWNRDTGLRGIGGRTLSSRIGE